MNPILYYWEGEKLRTTRNRVTKKWIFEKKNVYINNLGTVYKSKKSAYRGLAKSIKNDIDSKRRLMYDTEQELKQLERKLRKWTKLLKSP